jgi:hypothetical protein
MEHEKDSTVNPKEIVVVHRSETRTPGRWDVIEHLAKTLSIVAIPVVLAIVGWMVQDALSRRTVSRDYVQLAVSVLRASRSEIHPDLRIWAVDLLNDNSPTKFSPATIKRLKSGQLTLPMDDRFRGLRKKEAFLTLYLRYLVAKEAYSKDASKENKRAIEEAKHSFQAYVIDVITLGDEEVFIRSRGEKTSVKFRDGTVWPLPPELGFAAKKE